MHEFAMAKNLLEVARDEAARAGAFQVTRICVRIGTMRMMDSQLIQEAWQAAREGSICADAELDLEVCSPCLECQSCGRRALIDSWCGRCPACQCRLTRVIGGDELEIISMDIEVDESGPIRTSAPSNDSSELIGGAQ